MSEDEPLVPVVSPAELEDAVERKIREREAFDEKLREQIERMDSDYG